MSQKDDTGVSLELTIKDENGDNFDVSAYETTEIKLEKPDGTTTTLSASIKGSSNEILKKDLTSGTLDQTGLYKAQAHIADDDSIDDLRSDIARFEVGNNL